MFKGLDRPPTPLSFTQRRAEVVAAFLSNLTGDVEIETTDSLVSFSSTSLGHRLAVSREIPAFQHPLGRLDGQEHEIIHADLKTLLNAITILGAILPATSDRLDLRVRGRGPDASIRLSTPGDESRNSSDEFPIIRGLTHAGGAPEGSPGPSDKPATDMMFALNHRMMRKILNGMECVTVTGRYYQPQRLLHLEAAVLDQQHCIRSVYLAVQNIPADGPGQPTSLAPGEHPIGVDPSELGGRRERPANDPVSSLPLSPGISVPVVERVTNSGASLAD
jgi:hypothetical protein